MYWKAVLFFWTAWFKLFIAILRHLLTDSVLPSAPALPLHINTTAKLAAILMYMLYVLLIALLQNKKRNIGWNFKKKFQKFQKFKSWNFWIFSLIWFFSHGYYFLRSSVVALILIAFLLSCLVQIKSSLRFLATHAFFKKFPRTLPLRGRLKYVLEAKRKENSNSNFPANKDARSKVNYAEYY